MSRPIALILSTVLITGLLLSSCKEKTVTQVKTVAPKAATVEVITLQRRALQGTRHLPGELRPFESTDIYPKVSGFISRIFVDRGSMVRQGQVLATLSAPEISDQLLEARSRTVALQSQIAEARAKYQADESNYVRLKEAAKTPGVIAPIELITAQKTAEASLEKARSMQGEKMAAQAAAKSVGSIRSYLQVTAPFSGIVTARNLHPGALVGPEGSGNATPILRLENISHLRLVVSIPEADIGSLKMGMPVQFTVPAFPEKHFVATVSRLSHSLDEKTRTEPVELDINNSASQLDPGMYADVLWPVQRAQSTFVVPATAIVSTTECTFVIRVNQGVTEWVDVKRGNATGDQVEVFGMLNEGDQVVAKATDELRPNSKVSIIH